MRGRGRGVDWYVPREGFRGEEDEEEGREGEGLIGGWVCREYTTGED